MQIGLIGSEEDLRCQGLSRFLEQQDVDVVFVNSRSFEEQQSWSYRNHSYYYQGKCLDQVAAWYMATYPPALPASWTDYQEHYLYKDWFVEYMHKREHRNFLMSWLLSLQRRQIPMINPPEHMVGQQLKPLELEIAHNLGMQTPQTLVSNDPKAILDFVNSVAEPVYKPLVGYGHCHPVTQQEINQIEKVKAAPVIFQNRVRGTSVRVTLVDSQVISAVKIPSESLDYRNNPDYEAGKQVYEPLTLPDELTQKCQAYMQATGLVLAGIDFILTAEGDFVFLEANSSPMYVEIEMRTRAPITYEICTALLKYANGPERYYQMLQAGRQQQGFVSYALPFGQNLWT